jgi:hypothetical protein
MLLLTAGLALPGAPPRTSDSVADLQELLLDKRRPLLVGIYLAGLGSVAFLWFLGYLRERLAADGAARAAMARACAGGILSVILLLSGMAAAGGVALGGEASSDPALVRASIDVSNVLIGLSKFGLALLVAGAAAAGAQTGLLSPRMCTTGRFAAVLAVLSALPPLLADDGLWQYGGVPDVAGAAPATLWVIWLSLVLLSRPDPYPAR